MNDPRSRRSDRRWEFDCVVQNLRRASRLVSRRYQDALRAVNLTSSQYTILQALSGRDGLPHGLMAEILGFEQTTLSRLLATMEQRGLLKLVHHPKDRRQRLVTITPEGEALFALAKPHWQKEHDESLARMSDEDWKTLKDVLGRLSK